VTRQAKFSTLKMWAGCSSEMLGSLQTAWHCNPSTRTYSTSVAFNLWYPCLQGYSKTPYEVCKLEKEKKKNVINI
jgi:hypothetical protein